ncbi:MAG: protocatechuate 3,4-dioxygenase subunit alpha [Pseudomonadota bacterium]
MRETPSQTAGPYLHIGMLDEVGPALIGASMRGPGARGEALTLIGRITDGKGAPVADGLVEMWQPDADGRFPPVSDPALSHVGRCACDADGTFRFETVRPGAAPGSGAPHAAMMLYARGVNRALHLRCYFKGDPANADDPLLRAAGDRAHTLIARPDGAAWRLDIRLQGRGETVFLDV